MANQVLIAHTGHRLRLDFAQLTSVDDFRAFVTRQTAIPPEYIITLTPQGKPLRLAAFQTEKELYVYDARTAQADPTGSTVLANLEIPLPKKITVSNPPNDLRDQRSLAAWQELFHSRQQWAATLADECAAKVGMSLERYAEIDAMMRCLDAAVANLEAVVRGVESKYTEVNKWIASARPDYTRLVEGWEHYLDLARSIPISPAILQFMTDRESLRPQKQQKQQLTPKRSATLEDLVDLETAAKAAKQAPVALQRFGAKIDGLERSAPQLFKGCEEVLRGFEQVVDRSVLVHEGEAEQLLQDIKAVAAKIKTDYQTTLEYADSTRDVLQASKIAATHTERLLPSLRNRVIEMDEMLHYATQSRNTLAVDAVDFMRTITELTSLSNEVKVQIATVTETEDVAHFDYLRLVQQIPFVYASFIGEAIKRREWLDKVKTDSSTLANEMALFHDEEVKRRRRWQKSIGSLEYGPAAVASSADNQVAGLEVNLLGEEASWPAVTQRELDDFYEELQRNKVDADLITDIGKLIADIRAPTKQQTKRIRAFKNGSIHEAALGRSGLLVRGDDDVLRSLQDDKTKLDSKLKTAESRVRRLEDLLHRQSQASRSSLVGGGIVFQPSPLSQQQDSTDSVRPAARRLSSDRRASLDGGAEVRVMQRLQQVEAELASEKERSAGLEEKLQMQLQTHVSDRTEITNQMEEANSTKQDLLKNLEALERDFAKERKSLEDEIKKLQARIEDTEDEMEHFGESREHEKASLDERVHELQTEIERLSREQRDEVLKSQGQVDFLRREVKQLRDQNEDMAKQRQVAMESLRRFYVELGPDRDSPSMALLPPPEDLVQLVDQVSSRLGAMLLCLQRATGDLVRAEEDVKRTQEQLADEKTRAATQIALVTQLGQELSTCRDDLNQLQERVDDGETGSQTLRQKLGEEEQRAKQLADELALKQACIGSLEEELRMVREREDDTKGSLTSIKSRLDARTVRAKDLSQRLYMQNERLGQLLERLGFYISREDNGGMAIQRIPRAERSGVFLGSTSVAGNGAGNVAGNGTEGGEEHLVSAGLSGRRALGKATDGMGVELVSWMDACNRDTEADQYNKFLAGGGNFDVDAFSDAVYRRVKEVEHIGRKLQRDVRNYRDKAHALQREAHGKIAFKHFKEGDLALFLPTRNQSSGAWAAFNVGFPHYFLREQEAHRLQNREWLVARIQRIQERVVDLSKGLTTTDTAAGKSNSKRNGKAVEGENGTDNDNPFDLSDGLRWYLIDAQEDKSGAPSTPGLGKSTVAANKVEAVAGMASSGGSGRGTPVRSRGLGSIHGSVGGGRPTGIDGVSKTLSRSLESRRSSTSSRRGGVPGGGGGGGGAGVGVAGPLRNAVVTSETSSLRVVAVDGSGAAESAESSTAAAAASNKSAVPEPQLRNRDPAEHQGKTPPRLLQEQSAISDSPSKRSVVWDALWSLDYSFDTGKKNK